MSGTGNGEIDGLHQRLTEYACALTYEELPPEVVHAAKRSMIDTAGALIAGFFGEPCRITRDMAAAMPQAAGVTILGTRMKSTPDMAAFANAVAARYAELTDIYHWPGSAVAHPSDAVTPVLAAAEHAHASGRDFITSIVLAYEVCMRLSHVFEGEGFDNTNLACIGGAVGAGRALRLSSAQLANCISIAVVPNNVLRQARRGRKTMFKAVAAGHAGRAAVFSALMARAGVEGADQPFEGDAGWCDYVAARRAPIVEMGGGTTPFKILDARIKIRPAAGPAIACILAAEKIAPVEVDAVERVVVELDRNARLRCGTDVVSSREDADHSVPFLVAATLKSGTVTLQSFSDAHLFDPAVRALMQKVEIVENDAFTRAYEGVPQQHPARVTVITRNGERRVGDAGGDADDLAAPRTDAQMEDKFIGLTDELLGNRRSREALDLLWNLDELPDVAALAPALALG